MAFFFDENPLDAENFKNAEEVEEYCYCKVVLIDYHYSTERKIVYDFSRVDEGIATINYYNPAFKNNYDDDDNDDDEEDDNIIFDVIFYKEKNGGFFWI